MKKISSILFLISTLFAQPDSRFDTFDWVMYCQTGRINSISEGFNYTYFATENGGILRFNIYQDKFEEPITIAQGLSDNHVTAVHFDKSTGILWAASDEHINYSYSADGNWFVVNIDEFGLSDNIEIQSIGSSDKFIWLNAESVFIKIDKVSGIFFGIYPTPDDDSIQWSSSYNRYNEIPLGFMDYNFMDGWMVTSLEFINPYGKRVDLSTYLVGDYSNMYIGLEDGTIFKGNSNTEIFYPYENGLNQINVIKIYNNDLMWLVGDDAFISQGITKYNLNNNEFLHIDFENEINIRSDSFYSIVNTDDEMWFGGNSMITIFDKNDDYWRQIGEEKGLPSERINALVEDETSIWVGTELGLYELSKSKKFAIESEIEDYFKIEKINDLEIVDGRLWIATRRNLYIFDSENSEMLEYRDFGNYEQIGKRFLSFTNFTDLFRSSNDIFVSTRMGILKYNINNENWTMAAEPSSYNGSYIQRMAVEDSYCFVGTRDGLWQIDLIDGLSQLFDFKFIGSVNDLYIKDDVLYIGSDEGFIKYLWKKNL